MYKEGKKQKKCSLSPESVFDRINCNLSFLVDLLALLIGKIIKYCKITGSLSYYGPIIMMDGQGNYQFHTTTQNPLCTVIG